MAKGTHGVGLGSTRLGPQSQAKWPKHPPGLYNQLSLELYHILGSKFVLGLYMTDLHILSSYNVSNANRSGCAQCCSNAGLDAHKVTDTAMVSCIILYRVHTPTSPARRQSMPSHVLLLLASSRTCMSAALRCQLSLFVRRVSVSQKVPCSFALQSTVAVEHPYGHQPRPFATTVGFQVQGGFQVRDVHAPAAAHAAPAPVHASILGVSGINKQQTGATRTQPLARDAELTVNVPQRLLGGSYLSSSLSSSVVSKNAGFLPDISASFAGVPASPGPVGWQGLLEYSETSGCAGVLGPQTTVSKSASAEELR